MTEQEKIDLILEWALEKSDFNTDFVEQLQDKLGAFGSLSASQSGALDNIIEKWRIDS